MAKHPTGRNENNAVSNVHWIYMVLAFGPYSQMIKKHNERLGGNIGDYSEQQAIRSLNRKIVKQWWEL